MLRLTTFLLFITTLPGPLSVLAADYERFEENGKMGVKDNNGNVVLPASFDELGWSDGDFSVIGQITGYRQQNHWGLLNLKKEFITPAQYESLTWPGGDRVIVSKFVNPYTIKFGSIDLEGKLVVPFLYDDIKVHDLRAIVMVKNGPRYEYGLIDLNDRSVLPVRYQKITPIGSLRYAVQNFSNKIALGSEEGKWITDFVIDSISAFHLDLAMIYKGWRQGVIDRNGDIKIEPVYRDVRISSAGEIIVRKADEWQMMDPAHNELHRLEADELHLEANGWGRITLQGKSGLVDEEFNPRWPVVYDFVGPISNQKAIVGQGNKFGLLRLDQSAVLPIEFDSLCVAGSFVRSRQTVTGKSSWNLYDTFGIRKTGTSYEWIGHFNGRFFPAKSRGYWGGVDRYGAERIACVHDSLLEIKSGLIAVKFKGQYGVITEDDQWRLHPQRNPIKLIDEDRFIEEQDSLHFLKDFAGNTIYFTTNPLTIFPDHLLERLPDGTEKEINLLGQITSRKEPLIIQTEQIFRESDGLIGIKRDGKFGFVDLRGRLRIANRYDSIGEFHGGLAPVKLVGKWGFINREDQIVIQPTFETVEDFFEDIARISRNGKYGLVDQRGEILLGLRYDSIRRLPDQLYLISLNGLHGLADRNGNVLIEPRFDQLDPIDHGRVIVSREGLYGVLTLEGNSVFPIQYISLKYLKERNQFLSTTQSSWRTIDLN